MNFNLFSREFKNYLFSLILWTLVITLLVVLTLSAYPTFRENQSKIMGMISMVPKGALEFKGISNISDLTSLLGFYAVNNVIYMMVLGSIFSVVLGSNILLKEEYQKTADYLLSRPLTRSEVFLTKLALTLLLIVILNLVTASSGWAGMHLFAKDPVSFKVFFNLSLFTLMLNVLFGSAGLFISTLVKRARPVTTLCIGLVLFEYFLFTLSKITDHVSKLGYASPFKFVRTDVSTAGYGIDLPHAAYFIGLSLILLLFAYRNYLKKDIYI
jgi:ABC-2 type transport system permease protein